MNTIQKLLVLILVWTGASYAQVKWEYITNNPYSIGTTAPVTCTVGDVFFKTNATAGQNIYGCTTGNVWTVVSGAVSQVNGVTGAITLGIGTSGTSPAWSGGTLNIPSAGTASVTAGTISKTEYDTFNAKQAALGFTAENSANKGAASGYASLDSNIKVPYAQLPTGTSAGTVAAGDAAEFVANKGAASGYASLGSDTKVPYAQLPVGTSANTVAAGDDSRFSTAGVTSVNSATGAITLAVGSTGTAPAWSGGTLNLPLAVNAGVTAGLISQTQYNSFNSREPAISAGTSAQYYRGDKTMQTLDKTAVGLGNVENTALSTWAGTSNITAVGTLASGSVPWGRLTGVPGTVGDLSSVVSANDYNFDPLYPGTTLTASVPAAAAFAPCPLGVAGTNTGHYLWISGGTGTVEAVLITGGTCTSGAASGSITFTPANNHSGAWSISSASGGIQEAINDCPDWGVVEAIPPTSGQFPFAIKARVYIGHSVTIRGAGLRGVVSMFRADDYPDGDLFYSPAGSHTVKFQGHYLLAWATGHTSGIAFTFNVGNTVEMSDVYIAGGQGGIKLNGIGYARLVNVDYVTTDVTFKSLYGLYVTGNGTTVSGVTLVDNCGFVGSPTSDANVLTAGVKIDQVDGFWATNSMFFGDNGIEIDGSDANGFIANVQFTGCQVDTARNSSVHIHGTGKYMSGIKFTGCHLHSQGGTVGGPPALTPVVAIGWGDDGAVTADMVEFSGNNIQGSSVHGVYIGSTLSKHILFSGNLITGNNTSNAAVQNGIQIIDNATGLTIVGNTIGNYGTSYQDYGVYLLGRLNNSVITGNNLNNNDGSGIDWDKTSVLSKVVIQNNAGSDDVIGSVAADTSVTLPYMHSVVKITGTTAAIATLVGGWTGRKVRLIFTDASPDGVTTGGNILRAQTVAQYQAIDLTFDGTNWY